MLEALTGEAPRRRSEARSGEAPATQPTGARATSSGKVILRLSGLLGTAAMSHVGVPLEAGGGVGALEAVARPAAR